MGKEQGVRIKAQESGAFDAFASDYDREFTQTVLGRLLRQRVWNVAAQYFESGDSVLELACGTGEDARWLAENGVSVVATDGSAEMLTQTQRKTSELSVETQQLSLQHLIAGVQPSPNKLFDGVLSNFGGLNTINNWSGLARSLAAQVKTNGKVILVPMGPYCPIESLWYALHGEIKNAARRWRKKGASAQIGTQTIPIYYPSARQLNVAFGEWFRPIQTQSLGLWLPPSYLGHWVENRPNLWQQISKFETKTAYLTKGWGDHYITVLERR